jgi:hypothetical protein
MAQPRSGRRRREGADRPPRGRLPHEIRDKPTTKPARPGDPGEPKILNHDKL